MEFSGTVFNLASEGLESRTMELGSNGGAFSLEDDLGFRGGLLPLISVPFGQGEVDGSGSARWVSRNIGFLGYIKCLILQKWKLRDRKSEDEEDKRARETERRKSCR
uniref:Uncharacterized protein n=1 Tax=Cucumis melo TaxID=3656 RepID=A0A9I9D481_CUCME